jgi:hypothetical protein
MSSWLWWVPGGILDKAQGPDGDRKGWIELDGTDLTGARWAGHLWDDEDEPVYVPRRVDVAKFLKKNPLPYLWPDEPQYIKAVDRSADPAGRSRIAWLYSFLHHPDASVVTDALRHRDTGRDDLTLAAIAGLLASHGDKRVRKEAAKAAWRGGDETAQRVLSIIRKHGSAGDAEERLLAARPR